VELNKHGRDNQQQGSDQMASSVLHTVSNSEGYELAKKLKCQAFVEISEKSGENNNELYEWAAMLGVVSEYAAAKCTYDNATSKDTMCMVM